MTSNCSSSKSRR